MPDTWDGAAADAMLASHEFKQLDALLRSWIDVARSHEAVDWVDRRAEEGHVPVLYHAIRNLAKGGSIARTSGGRVMSGSEFRRAFRLALLLLVRAAQDILSIAVVQGQSPRSATFALLRDKVFGWLGAQFPVARWPSLTETLQEVARVVSPTSGPLPLPTWVLSASPSFASAYLSIGTHMHFDNPSDKAVAACEKTRVPLDEERGRVAAAFMGMVSGMSWEGVTGMAVSAFLSGATSAAAGLGTAAVEAESCFVSPASVSEATSTVPIEGISQDPRHAKKQTRPCSRT
jgi:hypothetical protein